MSRRPEARPSAPGPFSRPFDIEARRDYPASVRIEANEEERRALARAFQIPAIASLRADLTVARRAAGRFDVSGSVDARVTRVCVVTLEPFETEVHEDVDEAFVAAPEAGSRAGREVVIDQAGGDPPEPVVNGRIDLGALAAEYVALGLDPYPRKPGVSFDVGSEPDSPPESPFAALAGLAKAKKDG
jgi:uncharacterized metal-binding protein YceD (DUF177 family)